MKDQKKYNFLVADDEYPIVKIISDILALHPGTVAIFTANDGEKALQLYKNNDIDIVITDILMPRISGIELIKKLKEINPDAHFGRETYQLLLTEYLKQSKHDKLGVMSIESREPAEFGADSLFLELSGSPNEGGADDADQHR